MTNVFAVLKPSMAIELSRTTAVVMSPQLLHLCVGNILVKFGAIVLSLSFMSVDLATNLSTSVALRLPQLYSIITVLPTVLLQSESFSIC